MNVVDGQLRQHTDEAGDPLRLHIEDSRRFMLSKKSAFKQSDN